MVKEKTIPVKEIHYFKSKNPSKNRNLASILLDLNCSLLVSTLNASRLVCLNPKNENSLNITSSIFPHCAGIALENNKLAIGCKDEITLLNNYPNLANNYPSSDYSNIDSYWVPRTTYHTGKIQVHDLHFGEEKLWAINTSYSCLCTIDHNYSFSPQWKPSFIDSLQSEDRCHLNGLAMENGQPKYVTALSSKNTRQSWRVDKGMNGILMHIPSDETILENLAFPHTPRIFDGKLFLLLSGSGKLVYVDENKGSFETVIKLPGFPRGMVKHKDLLFIGLSKVRDTSYYQAVKNVDSASIAVIHLPSGKLISEIESIPNINGIYDLVVIPNSTNPLIINSEKYSRMPFQGISLPNKNRWNINS